MTREEFIHAVTNAVKEYIDNAGSFDRDMQLRVNPDSFEISYATSVDRESDIADSDEAIENAAAAYGDAEESAMDYQASQNPDFYPIWTLIRNLPGSRKEINSEAIERLATNYFGKNHD